MADLKHNLFGDFGDLRFEGAEDGKLLLLSLSAVLLLLQFRGVPVLG